MKDIVKLTHILKNDFTIIAEYPEVNYTLIYHVRSYENEWIVASGYDAESTSWCQGYYFTTLEGAMKFILNKKMAIPYERMSEIASLAIDGLFEDDRETALDYCDREIELTEYEREYFGIEDKCEEDEGRTPCDYLQDDSLYHCPYSDDPTTEMCRSYCGQGVDE